MLGGCNQSGTTIANPASAVACVEELRTSWVDLKPPLPTKELTAWFDRLGYFCALVSGISHYQEPEFYYPDNMTYIKAGSMSGNASGVRIEMPADRPIEMTGMKIKLGKDLNMERLMKNKETEVPK